MRFYEHKTVSKKCTTLNKDESFLTDNDLSRTVPCLHLVHVVKREKGDSRVAILELIFVHCNAYF